MSMVREGKTHSERKQVENTPVKALIYQVNITVWVKQEKDRG